MIWLCSEAPDAHQLSREWQALTGDSFIVDVRPMYGEIDGFLETFKYALKFSDLELSDNLHAYKTLKGKRLINSFGALRGVEVPEELTDDDLDDDLPYMLMLYTYRKGSGYNFSQQWTKISPMCTHYTLLCKVVRSYKTITPKTPPKDPQSSMGVFSFRCETATKCQGRRSRAFHP